SKYPYESEDGDSLKSEANEIAGEMVRALQEKVEAAGTEILGFELSDLSYAPEIAQAMLVRQQAQALVEARKTVVDGAVEIVSDSVRRLAEHGLELSESERANLVANLLTVICGDAKVQPTYPIRSVESGEQEEVLSVLGDIRNALSKWAGDSKGS
ncbi:MAG: SPFH domain-containing protein, partial [Planctomycetota bacterium]